MRRKKEKEKKKAKQIEENETVARQKKVTSHPVMQMQAIFGNRAIERAVKKNERFLRDRKRRSKRLSDSFETFDLIPIYRFPDSPQVGVRIYRTKEQFHYDHRLYLPKKRKDQNHNEENVKDQRKKNDRQFKKRSLIDSNFGLFQLEENQEIEDTNSKAKEYFLNKDGRFEQNDEEITLQEAEEMAQKKIKLGRFSFLLAYPLLVKLIRKKKKEEEKKQKRRKKSKISRFASRFSNKT